MKQTVTGKAFEYHLAIELSKFLNIPFLDTPEKKIGANCVNELTGQERKRMQRAADEATTFLCCHDSKFKQALSVALQPDKEGQMGDVRDLVIALKGGKYLGISTKNRHDAIKHPRLSDLIDFGNEWAEYPCSQSYHKKVNPIFSDLRSKRKDKVMFRDIPDKVNRYYFPVLTAFEDEFRRLCEDFGKKFVTRTFQYLLGRHDFYKVIKENGHVAIQSFNLNGQLEWGKKWKIPDRVDSITRKRQSSSTLIISFDGGWQLSFRLHNADKIATPSLKFDVRFIGLPQSVARHEIMYNVDLSN